MVDRTTNSSKPFNREEFVAQLIKNRTQNSQLHSSPGHYDSRDGSSKQTASTFGPNHSLSNPYTQSLSQQVYEANALMENSSPIKVHDQSTSSINKPVYNPNDYRNNSQVRTATYSPLNNSHHSSGKKSPAKAHDSQFFDPAIMFYESPGQKRPVLQESSKQVMRKVFDGEYSLDSPSRRRQQEKKEQEMYGSFKMENIPEALTTSMNAPPPKSDELDFDYMQRGHQLFLNKLKANPKIETATLEDILVESIDYLRHLSQLIRVGAIINIFEILYNEKQNLGITTINQITTQIFHHIPSFQANDDFYMLYCSMEALRLIGPNSVGYNNIKTLLAVISNDTFPKVQEAAFKTLLSYDYPGLNALLDLANKDFNDIPLYILNQFAQSPEIQARVIVPSLLNDFNSSDTKKKASSLAALNRLFSMTKFGGGLPILINLLQDANLDKSVIVSTILACGSSGEQALLKILKSTKDQKIKQAICSVFPWRVERYDRSAVRINIIPYQVSQHYQYNPGTMCVYIGNLKALSHLDITGEPVEQEDVIEINSRDFMASLQRLLTIKYQEFATKEQNMTSGNEELDKFNGYDEYLLCEYLRGEPSQHEPLPISPNIIKALITLCADKDSNVRDSAVNALGIIGPPEAADALDALVKCLYDGDSQIRATAAWAIGKLGDIAAFKATRRLIELLKDNFWKVRTSSCIALGYMGDNIEPSPYPILVKILKDGSINKVVVCETLVRLGVQGEQILLDILKQVPNSNYGLKSAIIQSLELADVDRPTIDFVIEELFRNSADQMIQVRKSCLITLEKLRSKASSNNITYLKSRNILPLFYFFLQDASHEMREMALQSIFSFGPQGELMLIEGLAKDKNPVIRAECAKGLGLFGPHTFRALIFGLRDTEESVRTATTNALKRNFSAEEVINTFKDKHHQKPAIICSIREILNLNYYFAKQLKEYLQEILKFFQNEMNQSRSNIEPLSTSVNKEELGMEHYNKSLHKATLLKDAEEIRNSYKQEAYDNYDQ